MSTVLGRMLQRSRGELPGIEPLVNSQQTPRALYPQQLEEVAEAAVQPRKAAAPPISHTPDSAERSQARLAARIPSAANPVAEQAEAPRPLPPAQALGEKNSSGMTSGSASQEAPARGSNELPTAASPQISKASLGPESNQEERPPLKLVAAEAQAQKAPAPRDTARSPAPSGDRSSRPERAEPEPQQTIETEQRTEIHITIGSIELRAPSAPHGQAKAQPFRPQVTLDEFLNRKPGASS